MSYFALVDSFR